MSIESQNSYLGGLIKGKIKRVATDSHLTLEAHRTSGPKNYTALVLDVVDNDTVTLRNCIIQDGAVVLEEGQTLAGPEINKVRLDGSLGGLWTLIGSKRNFSWHSDPPTESEEEKE